MTTLEYSSSLWGAHLEAAAVTYLSCPSMVLGLSQKTTSHSPFIFRLLVIASCHHCTAQGHHRARGLMPRCHLGAGK